VKTLFQDLAEKYADRQGGYTRIVKVGRVVVMRLKWLSWNWFEG